MTAAIDLVAFVSILLLRFLPGIKNAPAQENLDAKALFTIPYISSA